MKRNVIETVMGGVVLLVAVTFLIFAYASSDLRRVDGYEVIARFNRVDGLANGADVRLSGIKIGSVVDQELDPESYLAVVRLGIAEDIRLPTDTTAKIQSDGLLGNNYVVLEPGADEEMIADGGEIVFTQDPVNLADLIGRFIFSGPEGAGQGGSGGGTASPAEGAGGGLLAE